MGAIDQIGCWQWEDKKIIAKQLIFDWYNDEIQISEKCYFILPSHNVKYLKIGR